MGGDNVNVETVGDSTKVVYRTQDYTAQTEVLATVVDPAGANSEVRLYATAPGIYETELPTGETGMYHLNVRRTEDGEIRSYLTTAAVVQFSDEYKFNVTPEVYLNFANAYGKVIGEDDPVWTTIESKNREKRTLTNFLLGLAILLFLADVAMRRFQYVPQVKVRAKRRTAQHTADTDAQTEEQKNTRPTEQSDVQSTEPKKPVPQKPKKTSKKKEADVLDTSQLLKKKDDRNI